MTTSDPDERRGLLSPDAALAIATALLNGATEQSIDRLLRLLARPEPERAAQRSPATNQDRHLERGEGPEHGGGEPVGPIQHFPLRGRVDRSGPRNSSSHQTDGGSRLQHPGLCAPARGPRNSNATTASIVAWTVGEGSQS
jgi:hypothetical protein